MKLNMQAALLTIIIVGMVILIAFALMGSRASASAECMTMAEARTKWPNAHLWWHTKHRCWDNQPGRTAAIHRAHRAHAEEPAPKTPTKPFPAPSPRAEPSILYPSLISLQHGVDASFLINEQLTSWPLLIDIDQPEIVRTEEPNEIDRLADEPSFAERWQQVPLMTTTMLGKP